MVKKKPIRGRPRKEINLDIVLKAASIGCTNREIGALCGVSEDTIERRQKTDKNFFEIIEEGRARGKITLRRLLWSSANSGSVAMQIFLSKQMLGYRDTRRDHESTSGAEALDIEITLVKTR